MNKSKLAASLALILVLSGCAQASQRQRTAMGTGALIGGLLGAGAGGGIAAGATKHDGFAGTNKAGNVFIGVAAGTILGMVIGALLGYAVADDPRQPPPP